MKLRTGFVSNSSSSSFIVVDKPSKPPCECCGRGYPDLEELINRASDVDRDSGIIAVGKEDISGTFGGDGWGEVAERVDKVLESIRLEPDEKVMLVEISYHNEMLNEMVKGCRVCVPESEWYD